MLFSMTQTLTANPAAGQTRLFSFSERDFKKIVQFQTESREVALKKAAEHGEKNKLLCMNVFFGKQRSGARSVLNAHAVGAKKASTSIKTPFSLKMISQNHPEFQLHPNHPQVVGTHGTYYCVRNQRAS